MSISGYGQSAYLRPVRWPQMRARKGASASAELLSSPHVLQRGDIVSVRKPPVEYSFRVVELLSSRVGAKRVPEFMENVTPAAQYELLELQRISGFVDRAKGLGRPTKKDRRDLDQFAEDMPEDLDLFDWDEDWD